MPTTEEYWDVDGQSLNEFDINLRTRGGSREEPPPFRGVNDKIPFSYGDKYIEKIPDSRDMELDGWMTDTNERRLKSRWRAFRSLLWRSDEEFNLTRRWFDDNDQLLAATGKAEYVSGLSPLFQAGGTRLEFKVQIRMVDPFFYGTETLITMPQVGPYPLKILGDYATKFVSVQLTGAQQAVSLSVWRKGAVDNVLRYGGLSGGTALIDVNRGRATETLNGTVTPTSTKVGHSGRTDWLYLPPDASRIDYSKSSGIGTALVRYQPAYI